MAGDVASTESSELPCENVVNDNRSSYNQHDNSTNNNNLKRKAFDRLAESNSKQSGRGSLVGWTPCPLCGRYSTKRFALGRGISSHLYAVHTPWNPGKIERKKRRRLEEERQIKEMLRKRREDEKGEAVDDKTTPNHCSDDNNQEKDQHFTDLQAWQPTPQEVEAWDAKVLEIINELEAKAKAAIVSSPTDDESTMGVAGLERNGQPCKKYRESLPPFLQAAADGDLKQLEQMVDDAKCKGVLMRLIETRDRHLSTAEHWAAGGGHVDCLQFLLQARKEYELSQQDAHHQVTSKNRKMRRRDGKTCLHYAARYGQLECARYLLDGGYYSVDEVSGDGTTPLHLACYGLQVPMVQFLIKRGANVKATNEWGCSAAHWTAMAATTTTKRTLTSSIADDSNESSTCDTSSPLQIYNLANLLRDHGVSFVEQQKQGHSAMHKAAQRQNRQLLEWFALPANQGGAGLTKEEVLAGACKDDGGHTPSAIWKSVGGDSEFADWMETQGW